MTMDVSAILLAIVVILAATAVCVILFVRLGFGAILGFAFAMSSTAIVMGTLGRAASWRPSTGGRPSPC